VQLGLDHQPRHRLPQRPPDLQAATVHGVRVRLIKPLTFMNLSGQVLRSYMRRPFWTPPKDLLVVVDEVQLPVGGGQLRR